MHTRLIKARGFLHEPEIQDPRCVIRSGNKINDLYNFYIVIYLVIYIYYIIPKSLRSEVLKQLHASHQGIERTQRRATVYWPRIISDITVMMCAVVIHVLRDCQANKRN